MSSPKKPLYPPKLSAAKKAKMVVSTTIDSTHRSFLNEFIEDETVVESLVREREKLQKKKGGDVQRITEIDAQIKRLQQKKKNYYLSNSQYIFDYFETKKGIDDVTTTTPTPTIAAYSKKPSMKVFFKQKDDGDDTQAAHVDGAGAGERVMNPSNVQRYMQNVNDRSLDITQYMYSTDTCRFCKKGELYMIEDDGVILCNSCYHSSPTLIENDKPSYKEPPKEICFYAYRPLNHFKEILVQFQGKETTYIPQEVIDAMSMQIKKERIELSDLTYEKTKEMLKKLHYNKLYEHINYIKNRLGIPPPVMSQELEETLCKLFNETLTPYAKYCPPSRLNYLNYYYTLYKLCELLGERKYLEDLSLMKAREKRIEQDEVWKKICGELGWEFIPTP
jgi:hypothetical protein